MGPVMTRIPEPIHTFQEASATLGRDERREPRNYRRIMPNPGHDGAVVGGPAQADCLTSSLNWKAALGRQVGHHLPSLSRP